MRKMREEALTKKKEAEEKALRQKEAALKAKEYGRVNRN
jgi:hypothetical protein